jgi:predicted metal-dependent phosphoesterase TrpH
LHTHSTASDGSLTPSRLIEEAANQGLSAIALTDHDTIEGLEEAKEEADKRGIRFIPGVELEIQQGGAAPPGEFHLLGLGLTHPTRAFLDTVAELSRLREERNLKILDRMRELSIDAA